MSEQINIQEIIAESAYELSKNNMLFLDVREDEEIDRIAFDVPKLLNIQFSDFDEKYVEVPKDMKIILCCQMGVRSLRAAQYLVIHGWNTENIFNLTGGMKAWADKKLPVIKAPRSFSFAKPASSCGCGSGGCC